MFCHRCRREVHLIEHLCHDRTPDPDPDTIGVDQDGLTLHFYPENPHQGET